MNCSYPECKCPIDAYGNTPCQMDAENLVEPKCKTHPDAPHGFDRNGSHSMGRYVCDCENWEPDIKPDIEQVKTFLQRLKIQSMRTTNDISKILESLE